MKIDCITHLTRRWSTSVWWNNFEGNRSTSITLESRGKKQTKPKTKRLLINNYAFSQTNEIRGVKSYICANSYQHSLQLTDCLMLYRLAVNFSNLIANMQCCLSMYHTAVHDSSYNAPSIFCHFQCDALNSEIRFEIKHKVNSHCHSMWDDPTFNRVFHKERGGEGGKGVSLVH